MLTLRILLAQLTTLLVALAVIAPALAWRAYLEATLPPRSVESGAVLASTVFAGTVPAADDGASVGGASLSDQSRRGAGARHSEGR